MENWKPIPVEPFGQFYSVSDLGRVKRNKPSPFSRTKSETLKPVTGHRGYPFVAVHAYGVQKSVFIHKMVALAFLGPPPFKGAIVCHKDDCKTNNHAGNLEWGTCKSNSENREALGVHSFKGEGNPRAILTEDQVRSIRREYKAGGITQCELGERYGVSQTVISKVVLRISWPLVSD